MRLPDFSSANVLVVGDLMLDRYWYGSTSRISPEAPVPVVHVGKSEERVGGAGNVALNIAALGSHASVIGLCGNDAAADTLQELMESAKVRCLLHRVPNRETITKLRVLSRNQQLIRLDFEDGFQGIESDTILDFFRREVENIDAVVLSDYGKGTLRSVQSLIAIARNAAKPVLVDPKGRDFSIYSGATVVTPNLAEFEGVVGPCGNSKQLVEKGQRLIRDLGIDALLVTRGEHGMTLIERDAEPLHLPTQALEVYDVTGAGDTVISVLAAGLAAGLAFRDSTAFANVAAGIVVAKLGTAAITLDELRYALQKQRAHHRGIIEVEPLVETLAVARSSGEKIVATNGCFDILHPGHIAYLQQARNLGDRLVVLVNSDASVRRLKGPQRPVNNLKTRMAMLAALECVDWVISFAEDTPETLLCRILPDILVKGGDYQDVTALAGYGCITANGGRVLILDFVEGFSTSEFIRNLRENG
ncbi:MAG: bifunctional D-glycero-beta-D-manno-heptose-7-phosphate kinase/D-glycero-beta-D-manno-heptose 1-phosphate adenylyltransferase HldE [Methylococcaceae bacterium]|nr:bifunctional D-glycero-beta-D-manno-heptose-7-phosphate kinase/D-glycero-beta-D-manno-heptose 1-phosphate adenylyltransferase HldE [Methylococcaceae bacterium]MCI0733661.1 bifunctional D-glycero-beta-D-manno-heptose-7-phosphate kinase/D-glycero-beta-D-manno-heptose 1-phosphate adenylyltransferase HldE [Methylococcaceae bacterium]